MKIFRVWQESCEERTKYHENWTEQELIDAYNRQTSCDPTTLKTFEDEKEAYDYYNSLTPNAPYESPVSVGRVITYEVIGIDEEEVDEDGEFVELYNSEMKATPLVYEED